MTILPNSAPGISGSITVFTPSTSAIHMWSGQFGHWNGTNASVINVSGFWNSAAVVDGFEVVMAAGNIASGTIKVYGIQ